MELTAILGVPDLVLAAAAGIVTMWIRQYIRSSWWDTEAGRRVLPLVPAVIALVGSLAGLGSAGPWGNRIVAGIVAGAIAAYVYKLQRTVIFGKGLDE